MKCIFSALTAVVVLAACGGGSPSGSAPIQGSTTAVSTSGTITAFGSVYVNGVRYDVTAASLKKNGQTVAQSALAVGEVAHVSGHQDLQGGTGSADTVDVDDSVVGPIATTDVAGGKLSVLGQTVLVTASTSFGGGISPADLTGLKAGDSIEVSGLADATGAITATRIARAGAAEPLQVLGAVAGVDTTMKTFMINGLTIDYVGATGTAIATGHPANGDLVVASGAVFDAAAVKLTALTLRMAASETAASGQRTELEGLITRFTSLTDFAVAGQAVSTTATTVFKGGSSSSLALNSRVEVSGTLDAGGTLVADTIRVEQIAALALEAPATAVDAANNSLTVLGIAVTVDGNTRFEDKSAAQVQLFTLKDVSVGDTVRVRGYESPAGSGNLLALRLERVAPQSTVALRGPFTATTAPLFKILGVTVDATDATFGMAESAQTLTSTAFFTQAVGQIVAVQGTSSGGTVTATDVRIDSHEDR